MSTLSITAIWMSTDLRTISATLKGPSSVLVHSRQIKQCYNELVHSKTSHVWHYDVLQTFEIVSQKLEDEHQRRTNRGGGPQSTGPEASPHQRPEWAPCQYHWRAAKNRANFCDFGFPRCDPANDICMYDIDVSRRMPHISNFWQGCTMSTRIAFWQSLEASHAIIRSGTRTPAKPAYPQCKNINACRIVPNASKRRKTE